MSEKTKINFGVDCNKDPLDGNSFDFFNKDYSNIYKVFKDSGLLVYPVRSPTTSPKGKAFITNSKNELLARYTTNGTFVIFDDEFFESIKIKTFNVDNFLKSFKYTMDFLKRIKVITSYDENFLQVLEDKLSDKKCLNLTFRASRKDKFFMDGMFGNKSNEKIVNYSKIYVLGEDSLFEQANFNMFSSFKILTQPVDEFSRFDFLLNVFTIKCVMKNEQYEKLDLLMKRCVKEYLLKREDIDFDLDYIFTESFFIEYETIKQMMEI